MRRTCVGLRKMKGHVVAVKRMDSKNKFQEMLGDILEVARVQDNRLGMNEIKDLFGDMNLSEAQYEQIFAYLAAHHITIQGYAAGESEYTKAIQKELEQGGIEEDKTDKAEEDSADRHKSSVHDEDSVYLKMYLEDLKEITQSTPEEEISLIDKIIKGDDFARSRYIEGKLHYVVKIAEEYKNLGVSMEDLIQEGNIGLISALESMSELGNSIRGKDMVTDFIRKFMEAAIEEQNESSSFENNIIKKINYIRAGADELAEDLGREADIHELAGYIKMTEQEISDILRMSVEGIKIDNKQGSKGGHPEDGHHDHTDGHDHSHPGCQH